MAIKIEHKTPVRATAFARQAPPAKLDIGERDQDPVILQFTTRYITAGFKSHSAPTCVLPISPELTRRAGDYHMPAIRTSQAHAETWSSEHELWQLDLRDTSLPLLEDKLHRALSIIYLDHLLIDSKAKHAIICLEPCLPHRLIVAILDVCFGNLQIPGLTLLSTPTLQLFGTGQRSGLIVDIGWFETIVTVIYEFREMSHHRTTRAMSALTKEFLEDIHNSEHVDSGLELAEELIARRAWCKSDTDTERIEEESDHENDSCNLKRNGWRKVERVLFADGRHPKLLDDHEHGVQHIAVEALLASTSDVRAACMTRVVIGGCGSKIPGIKSRILREIHMGCVVRKPVWKAMSETKPGVSTLLPLQNHNSGFQSAEHGHAKKSDAVRGLRTLGVFAGCSLLTAFKSRGLVVLERERYLSDGFAQTTRPTSFSTKDSARATRIAEHDFIWPLGVWS